MKTNTHIVPFFNKTADLKAGLNQLGLRNASEALFTSLLPGLNNVSNRIRYYSFYCWLIGEFYKNRESFTDKEFYKYIRYSEYLLALIHSRGQGVDGIPGIKREREILIGNLASGCQTGYKLLSLGQRGGLISAC